MKKCFLPLFYALWSSSKLSGSSLEFKSALERYGSFMEVFCWKIKRAKETKLGFPDHWWFYWISFPFLFFSLKVSSKIHFVFPPTHISCSNSSCVKSPYTNPCTTSSFNFHRSYPFIRIGKNLFYAVVPSCIYVYIPKVWGCIIMCKYKTVDVGRCP